MHPTRVRIFNLRECREFVTDHCALELEQPGHYRLFNHTYSQNKPITTKATIIIVRSVLFISIRYDFRSLKPIHRLDANNTYLHVSFTWAELAVVLGGKSVGFPS